MVDILSRGVGQAESLDALSAPVRREASLATKALHDFVVGPLLMNSEDPRLAFIRGDREHNWARFTDIQVSTFIDGIRPGIAYVVRQFIPRADELQVEDILQETALRTLGAFDPSRDVKITTFANQICRNLCKDLLKNRVEGFHRQMGQLDSMATLDGEAARHDPQDQSWSSDPLDVITGVEDERLFDEVVGRLPEPQRLAWEAIEREGMTYREAAEAAGVSLNTVKVRVHRAREYLRAHYGQTG